MTIATTTSRVDYTGNGVTTAFAVPFVFFGAGELRVISRVIATGVETVLSLSTHYTVSGGNGATGTVTAVTPPASTVQWTILRSTARTQQVDYITGDPFPANTHERALDRLTALVQENERDQARAVRVAETDTAAPVLPTSASRAGRYLAFDASGVPIAAPGTTSVIPTTPWSEGLLLQSAAAGGRTHLGATATGAAVFTASDAAAARTAVGATTTGAAVLTAVDAAAARTAIGATSTGSAVITATDAAAARTAVGATSTGSAVITANNAAAARTTLGAPAIPTALAGAGNWAAISVGPSSSYTLPAGGTWAFFLASYSGGSFTSATANIAAGGTIISATGPTNAEGGFAWRIA